MILEELLKNDAFKGFSLEDFGDDGYALGFTTEEEIGVCLTEVTSGSIMLTLRYEVPSIDFDTYKLANELSLGYMFFSFLVDAVNGAILVKASIRTDDVKEVFILLEEAYEVALEEFKKFQ